MYKSKVYIIWYTLQAHTWHTDGLTEQMTSCRQIQKVSETSKFTHVQHKVSET